MIRIGTLLSILMLILIPLLSSPVAAAFTFDVSTAWTDNTSTGPTVGWTNTGGNPPGVYGSADATPRNAVFTCDFSFKDTSGNTQTPSSRHYGEMEVFKNPQGPRQVTNTGNVWLNNGGSNTATLTITDTYTIGEVPVTWDIMLYVECEDYPTQTMAWNTYYWTYTVF